MPAVDGQQSLRCCTAVLFPDDNRAVKGRRPERLDRPGSSAWGQGSGPRITFGSQARPFAVRSCRSVGLARLIVVPPLTQLRKAKRTAGPSARLAAPVGAAKTIAWGSSWRFAPRSAPSRYWPTVLSGLPLKLPNTICICVMAVNGYAHLELFLFVTLGRRLLLLFPTLQSPRVQGNTADLRS